MEGSDAGYEFVDSYQLWRQHKVSSIKMMYLVVRRKKGHVIVEGISRTENYVEVGVMTPIALLPLDLRESLGPSYESARVLGSELL